MDVGAAVGDEDLLPVEEEAAVLLGGAGDDAAQVGAGLRLGQIHAALQLPRHEARQVALAELLAPVPLDVLRHAGLEPDDRHQARVGARDHLEVSAVDEHRQAVATVLATEGQAEEPRAAELLVARRDVRRDDHPAALEPHLLVPVVEGTGLDVLADLPRRAEDRLVGLHLVGDVRLDAAEVKVPAPVEPVVDEELDVPMEEVSRHAGKW